MNVSILENQTDVVKVNFVSTLQGKFNNAFASLSAKSFKIDKFTGNAIAISNDVKIEVSHFESFKFNVTVQRVFDIFILKLSTILPLRKVNGDSDFRKFQTISLSLREFMTLCNIKNKTCAIEQLRNALNFIGHTHIEFSDTVYNGKKKLESAFFFCPIVVALHHQKGTGIYSATFSMDFLKHLANSFIMPFPLQAFSIDLNRYPMAYQVCRRLALHHNMNYFKSNASNISVQALIGSLSLLPTHQEILNGNRQVTKRIINPLEKALDFLVHSKILTGWHYNLQFTKKTYEQWIVSSIVFTFYNFPERKNCNTSSGNSSAK